MKQNNIIHNNIEPSTIHVIKHKKSFRFCIDNFEHAKIYDRSFDKNQNEDKFYD